MDKWKATNSQKQEIMELLGKLGWSVEQYEIGVQFTLENCLWFQAVSAISGLTWMADNPKEWQIK